MVLSERLVQVMDTRSVDLVCLHWMSYDVATLIDAARHRGIPYVVVNHFANERLRAGRSRHWLAQASGIGGVSGLGVPRIKARFVNLGDAIDIDVFDCARVNRVPRRPGALILLPARIEEGKGHLDLLQAARILIDHGHEVSVAFAGAVDSQPLFHRLRSTIVAFGLKESVTFMGDLEAADLRAW